MAYRYALLAALVAVLLPASHAQISLTTAGTANVQDFEAFTAAGFAPTPTAGQLNSNAFLVRGAALADGGNATVFGGTYTAAQNGEFARGRTATPSGLAGVNSFSVAPGNLGSFGIQPNNNGVFDPGAFYVRYQNDTGAAVTSLRVAYDLFVRNDQPHSNRLDFAYRTETDCSGASPTAGTYTTVAALDFVTIEAGTSGASFERSQRSARLGGVALPAGGCLTLRFSTNQLSGAGNNDEIGVDNVSLAPNPAAVAAQTVTQTLGDGRAYRMLAPPVQGVSVADLAAVNLVQGVPAGGGNAQQQYPAAPPNLYTSYTGAGYGAAPTTGFVTAPGRGFFWEFYDAAIPPDPAGPFGGGTSQSYLIPERALTATGVPVTTTATVSFATNPDNFYMIGNPFAQAVSAGAIAVQNNAGPTRGIQGDGFQAYDGTTGSYQFISRTTGIGPTTAAVWQGFFAEVAAGVTAPTFTFDAPTAAAATFYGRTAATLALALRGTTASGAETLDEAALIRFSDAAADGWDVLDASKLFPFGATVALVAPAVSRDGAPHRVAVDARPMRDATVPLHLFATEAGTYTLTAAGLPDGWTASLRDLATGSIASLADGYTFTSDATGWTNRFDLVLGRGTTAGETAPAALALGAPRPNPASQRTTLALRVDAAQRVTATVVDALGRTVGTVFDADLAAGADVEIAVDARALAPGVYVVRVAGETFAEARRLTVVR